VAGPAIFSISSVQALRTSAVSSEQFSDRLVRDGKIERKRERGTHSPASTGTAHPSLAARN